MDKKSRKASQEKLGRWIVPFEGVKDSKGREYGVAVTTSLTVFGNVDESDPRSSWSYWRIEPGSYYTVCLHATRGGSSYGASQPDHHFPTAMERDEFIAKYLKRARRTAEKSAAKSMAKAAR